MELYVGIFLGIVKTLTVEYLVIRYLVYKVDKELQ